MTETTTPEERALAEYRAILASVGARAGDMGRRPIASHWPHLGSAYRRGGLLYAGQALDGWDAPVTPARWWPREAATEAGREKILAGTRGWHADLPEPLWGVMQYSNRPGSSFWSLGAQITEALLPGGPNPWYSRIAWANVYPLGYDELVEPWIDAGPPVEALREAQDPHVGALLGAFVEMIDPGRIIIVSGPDYWRHAERELGLALSPAPFPLIRAGRAAGRSWVIGYHPGYSRKAGRRLHGPGTGTNAYYVETVKRVLHEIEG
jgi:hypothetical protein